MPSESHYAKPPGRSMVKRVLVGVSTLIVLSSIVTATLLFQRQQRQTEITATTTAQSRNATAAMTTLQNTAIAHNQQATTTAIAVATTTVTAYPSYMPGSGTLALHDPLQKELYWKKFVDNDDHSACWYENDGLHVQTNETSYYFVCGEATPYTDFAFEVQMTMLKGDCG